MSRIFREYKKIQRILGNDESFDNLIIELAPSDESDLSLWHAIIKGPPNTPYDNHHFGLTINISPDYPVSPPVLRFEASKMPHCNVNFQTGEICLDILTPQHWSPAWDLLNVLKAIEQLLSEPVPDSPLNIDIANLLKVNDNTAYKGLIHYYLNGGT